MSLHVDLPDDIARRVVTAADLAIDPADKWLSLGLDGDIRAPGHDTGQRGYDRIRVDVEQVSFAVSFFAGLQGSVYPHWVKVGPHEEYSIAVDGLALQVLEPVRRTVSTFGVPVAPPIPFTPTPAVCIDTKPALTTGTSAKNRASLVREPGTQRRVLAYLTPYPTGDDEPLLSQWVIDLAVSQFLSPYGSSDIQLGFRACTI